MGPADAIKTGLAKSFQYKGRTTRPEFWWFAPIGLGIGAVGCWIGASLVEEGKPITLIFLAIFTLIGFLPLTAAGSRRLQDSGENGQDIFLPIAPFIALMVLFSVSYHVGLAIFMSLFVALPAGLILAVIYYIVLTVVLVIAPIAGLMFLGPVMGQLLIPSEPGTNRFGPNPNEVPS